MPTLEIPLPAGVAFDRPKDYVAYCKGMPVRLSENPVSDDKLRISWDGDWVRFSYGTNAVEYYAAQIAALCVNLTETVMTWKICSFRVIFQDPDGSKVSLPVLTSDEQNRAWFTGFAATLCRSHMPFPIKLYPENTK